jgi:hypothetical protein
VIVRSNAGNIVYIDTYSVKRRETTAGPEVNLDTQLSGAAGG